MGALMPYAGAAFGLRLVVSLHHPVFLTGDTGDTGDTLIYKAFFVPTCPQSAF